MVWDQSKTYNVVHTTEPELHLCRLVWRWGDEEAEWKMFEVTRMHYGERCAMCGLIVAKSKVADLGISIDHDAVFMIKKTYLDDGSGRGLMDTVDQLLGDKVTDNDDNVNYTGTISQIFAQGGFQIN